MESLDLKDGDIVNGRPVRVLSTVEAQLAIGSMPHDKQRAEKLYGGKGSRDAKAKMAKVRAAKDKRKAIQKKAQLPQECPAET